MSTSSATQVLAVTKLSPLYAAPLEQRYTVHAQSHLGDADTFARIAPSIAAIAASGESKVPGSLIAQLPALRIISVMGVGYDGVDALAARERGVMVTHTPDVLNDEVADLALALMLAAARQIPAADRYVRSGRWLEGAMPLQRKMSGGRLGLVGMGRIAKAIAHRAVAFGMSVAYTARTAKPELGYAFHASARALAAVSDFLVVITPGGAGTRKLIDADVLAALGKGRGEGIIVNVARGSVIDEPALIEALQKGVIAAAGLDVFENEPRVPQALIDLPHVVLTPHVGSATTATRQAMADLALENLRRHLAGEAVLTPVPECRT